MKNLITALKLFVCMTVITGIVYPFAVWCCGQAVFKEQAEGSILTMNGRTVGSGLIGQNFSRPDYFWPRPSAVNYDPMPSGGSNLSLTSTQLQAALKDRKAKFPTENVPSDLLFASGSGLDPHISPEAAHIQCARVAHMRGVPEVDIMSLVDAITEPRQAGFLGEPRVNVLRVNLKLDEKYLK
jgi:K+-transporting ATPase ATPase C chain